MTPSEPFDPVYMKALFDLAEAKFSRVDLTDAPEDKVVGEGCRRKKSRM